jgi:hypothetical protein
MPAPKFVKDNLVLLVGLTLPVVLMAGFLLASSLPGRFTDPPRYDLVFSIQDYPPAPAIPVAVRLVVKDHALKAQYTKLPAAPGGGSSSAGWRKLFIYEASTGKVRELTFGFPPDMDAITGTREETVDATAGLRLDTALQAPDGYQLSWGEGRRGGGLFSELFIGSRGYHEPRLRKGSASVPLGGGPNQTSYAYQSAEFIGWVTGKS